MCLLPVCSSLSCLQPWNRGAAAAWPRRVRAPPGQGVLSQGPRVLWCFLFLLEPLLCWSRQGSCTQESRVCSLLWEQCGREEQRHDLTRPPPKNNPYFHFHTGSVLPSVRPRARRGFPGTLGPGEAALSSSQFSCEWRLRVLADPGEHPFTPPCTQCPSMCRLQLGQQIWHLVLSLAVLSSGTELTWDFAAGCPVWPWSEVMRACVELRQLPSGAHASGRHPGACVVLSPAYYLTPAIPSRASEYDLWGPFGEVSTPVHPCSAQQRAVELCGWGSAHWRTGLG